MSSSIQNPGSPDQLEQPTVRTGGVPPPVEPPSAAFLIQLFVIPMIIVIIVVSVWGFFSWLVSGHTDPYELVGNIRALNDASWQSAYQLSELLRNPEYRHIKKDTRLAQQLASALEEEIRAAKLDEQRIKLRIFLCRALGEFQVPEVLDALVLAARTERDLKEIDVRRSALEALAVLAGQWDRTVVANRADVLEVLLAASKERSDGPDSAARNDVRATAAFALGVLGSPAARERLAQLLDDAHPNTRYNAATGLARAGDSRAIPALLEMLDPNNPEAIAGEFTEDGRLRKRLDVLGAAIAASVRLAQADPTLDLTVLRQSIEKLHTADTPKTIRVQAEEALHLMQR
jgi:HEAT repeat protein